MQPYNQTKWHRLVLFLAIVLTVTAYACESSTKAPESNQPEKTGVEVDTTKTGQAPPPPVNH